MSQSDYLKHRVTSHLLKIEKNFYDNTKNQNEFKPVLNSSDYTSFKKYQIYNTVKNDGTNYRELVPDGKNLIFDMELDVSNCPQFILCKNTNTRSNRVPLSGKQIDPNPCPSAPLYIKNHDDPKDPINVAYVPNRFAGCKCNRLYSKYKDENGLDKDKAPNLQCCKKSRLRMQFV